MLAHKARRVRKEPKVHRVKKVIPARLAQPIAYQRDKDCLRADCFYHWHRTDTDSQSWAAGAAKWWESRPGTD